MLEEAKKTLVIYKSKYGSTKRYAEWIAKDAKADLLEISMVKINDLQFYDIIVFAGFLHAVSISGVKIITDNFEKLKDKKIIVIAVGCSPARNEAIHQVISSNFTGNMRDKINFFYLRGIFNYNNLGFVDMMMMNALRLKLKRLKDEELDEESKGLLECYDKPVDWTDKMAIVPIIECINSNCNNDLNK